MCIVDDDMNNQQRSFDDFRKTVFIMESEKWCRRWRIYFRILWIEINGFSSQFIVYIHLFHVVFIWFFFFTKEKILLFLKKRARPCCAFNSPVINDPMIFCKNRLNTSRKMLKNGAFSLRKSVMLFNYYTRIEP